MWGAKGSVFINRDSREKELVELKRVTWAEWDEKRYKNAN